MALSNIIDMKIVEPCDGLILRFKNDFGGRDLVHFPGNYSISFQQGDTKTIKSNITDFSPSSRDRGTEGVLKITAGEKIQCSRFVKSINGPGMRQLFTSRFVELFTGSKNDTIENNEKSWLQVQVRIRDWNERIKENQIFVSVEIELPQTQTDEF